LIDDLTISNVAVTALDLVPHGTCPVRSFAFFRAARFSL